MKILIIDKGYINEYYNGNKDKAVQARDGVIISDDNILNAFCATATPDMKKALQNFRRYLSDNKSSQVAYNLEKQCYI